jgi:hypothetical protein
MSFIKFVRKDITTEDRMAIASSLLSNAGEVSISQLAQEYETSRKFITEQVQRAQAALGEAFAVKVEKNPVVEINEQRIVHAVRSLALDCHGSVRGIIEHLDSVWHIKLHEEEVVAILKAASGKAKVFNQTQDLSPIRIGAHDEIFSQRRAVLAGVDVSSTYVYVLESPGGRDSTSWGVVLLDKQEQQRLDLETVVADAAQGLRLGAREANPPVRIRGDLFHANDKINRVLRGLAQRAYHHLDQQYELEKKALALEAKGKDRRKYNRKLCVVHRKAEQAMTALDDLEILSHWLRELWQVRGYDYPTRGELYDWIVSEMARITAKKVAGLVTYLKNEKEALLEFVRGLDEELSQLRVQERLSTEVFGWLRQQIMYEKKESAYWKLEGKLLRGLGARLKGIQEKLAKLVQKVVRASSIVEAINSLLRRYFFLRKSVGEDFLPLLQFYLNARKYRRSGRKERVGKSPLELLTGKDYPDWQDLLDSVALPEQQGPAEAVVAQAA